MNTMLARAITYQERGHVAQTMIEIMPPDVDGLCPDCEGTGKQYPKVQTYYYSRRAMFQSEGTCAACGGTGRIAAVEVQPPTLDPRLAYVRESVATMIRYESYMASLKLDTAHFPRDNYEAQVRERGRLAVDYGCGL